MSNVDNHGGWPAVLGSLVAGEDLTREAARDALSTVLGGNATDAQIAAFIFGLHQKGETIEEISGLVDAMLDNAAPLSLPDGAVDIVGTGGAPSRRVAALSVSTMACFVASGAGACVAKHGNVKASATSGAFDTLDALGITTGLDGPGVERCLAEAGMAFVFAKAFHPAMRHAGPVRAQLGVPTVMNILGPLSHPGRVRRHLIGVADPDLQDLMVGVLANRGSEHAWIVHGHGRLDEIALTGPSRVVELKDGAVSEFEIDPQDYGISKAALDDIAGGDAETNAKIAHAIFDGSETGARRDIVVLNAAAALVVAGVSDDLQAGLVAAGASIADGSAAEALNKTVAASAAAAESS